MLLTWTKTDGLTEFQSKKVHPVHEHKEAMENHAVLSLSL